MDPNDRLKKTLGELTRQRSLRAPDFDHLVDGPADPSRDESRSRLSRLLPSGRNFSRPAWTALLAASVVVAVLLGGIVWLRTSTDDASVLAEMEQVTSWQAPSDVFLPSMEGILAYQVPPLGQTDLQIYTGTLDMQSTIDRTPR